MRNLSVSGPPQTLDGAPTGWDYSVALNEDWSSGTILSSRWDVEHNSTYGAPSRIQRYMDYNATVSAASPGGTGNSLKLTSRRESVGGNEFTAGMLGTRDQGVFYPRWARYVAKMRIPHGQGVWPAFWLRHRDGSDICEPDIMEYFIAEVPGRVGPQLHTTNNAGSFGSNRMPYTDSQGRVRLQTYEAPVAEGSQRWTTIAMDILPWTAGTVAGGTYGDPATANTNVLYRMWMDGAITYEWVDTSSLNWSQRYSDAAFDICIQGSQIGGTYVGHPDDPLGYSRMLPGCVIGGTAPNSCIYTSGGYTTRKADWPNTFELDWVRVFKYEGVA